MTTPAELQTKMEKLETNMARLDTFTNGSDTTTVTVDGGVVVPSIAKLMKDIADEYEAATVIVTAQEAVNDAFAWANNAEDSQHTDAEARTGYSAFHWAQKAAASAALLPLDKTDATVDPTISNDSSEGYSVGSTWYNIVSKEVFKCIDASVGAADWVLTTLTLDDLGALAAQDIVTIALMASAAKAYDIGFMAGFAADGTEEDVAVQLYGSVILTRPITFEDIEAYANNAPTGAAIQFDVKKNGVTIFATAPEIDDGSNADDGNHALSVTSGVAGDRISFELTQIGSTNPGSGVMFSLKGRLA